MNEYAIRIHLMLTSPLSGMQISLRDIEKWRPGGTSYKCSIIPVCRFYRWSMSRTLGSTLLDSGCPVVTGSG